MEGSISFKKMELKNLFDDDYLKKKADQEKDWKNLTKAQREEKERQEKKEKKKKLNQAAKGRRASRDLFKTIQLKKKKETQGDLEQIAEEQTNRNEEFDREEKKKEEEIEVDIHNLHLDNPPDVVKSDIFN